MPREWEVTRIPENFYSEKFKKRPHNITALELLSEFLQIVLIVVTCNLLQARYFIQERLILSLAEILLYTCRNSGELRIILWNQKKIL